MEVHIEYEHMQFVGMKTMLRLFEESGEITEADVLDSVNVVVTGMRAHEKSPWEQAASCAMLHYLVKQTIAESVVNKMWDAGALAALLAGLGHHSANMTNERGCGHPVSKYMDVEYTFTEDKVYNYVQDGCRVVYIMYNKGCKTKVRAEAGLSTVLRTTVNMCRT